MKNTKTLREIRDILGVSRKVIQGYENHDLITSCGKDWRGHRLYDEDTMKKIVKIRFYQKLGFTLSEIEKLMNSDENDLRSSLEKKKDQINQKIIMLEEKQEIINLLISTYDEKEINLHEDYMLEIARRKD